MEKHTLEVTHDFEEDLDKASKRNEVIIMKFKEYDVVVIMKDCEKV